MDNYNLLFILHFILPFSDTKEQAAILGGFHKSWAHSIRRRAQLNPKPGKIP
jgi:hypothetical protein